jgi:hypothetical protein
LRSAAQEVPTTQDCQSTSCGKTATLKEPLFFFEVEVHPEYKTSKDVDKENEQDFKKEAARTPNQGSSI